MSNTDGSGKSGLSSAVIGEIRSQAIKTFAAYLISLLVALVGIAAAGWWLYLKERLPIWFGGMPVHAVIAYNDPGGCKKLGDGWKEVPELQGKTIFGAVGGDKRWQYYHPGGNENGEIWLQERHSLPHFIQLNRPR
jgi:hypothetical protein